MKMLRKLFGKWAWAAYLAAFALVILFGLPPAQATVPNMQFSATVQSGGGVLISWRINGAPAGYERWVIDVAATGSDSFTQDNVNIISNGITDPSGASGQGYNILVYGGPTGNSLVGSDSVTASGSAPTLGNGNANGSGSGTTVPTAPSEGDTWDIFPGNIWNISLEWYEILATLSGVFIFFAFLRVGFQYIKGQENPSNRADLISQIQRVFIAIVLILIMPLGIQLAISVNNDFVGLLANMLNHYTNQASIQAGTPTFATGGVFENILTWPFTALANLIQSAFGLNGIDTLIFNGHQTVFNNIFTSFTNLTSDPFSDALIKLALLGFQVFFNALFTIRQWVVRAVFVATPLLIWVWVITEEMQVIEILIAEIISAIFLQSAYALPFAIFFSILAGPAVGTGGIFPSTANIPHGLGVSAFVAQIVQYGEFAAGLAGGVAFLMLVINGLRLIIAEDEKVAAGAYTAIRRILFGTVIVSIALALAGFIVGIVGGISF